MKVSYPNSQPTGFHLDTGVPLLVRNDSKLDSRSLGSKAFVGTGAVLFKFTKFSDPVRITVVLSAGEHWFTADLDVPTKGGNPRYVLFGELPLFYNRDPRFYQYEVWITSPADGNKSVSAYAEVLYKR